MKIKVVSWNIWYGKYLDEIIKYLKDEKADIVCLQETVANMDGSDNTAKKIAQKLSVKFLEYSFALQIKTERRLIGETQY